MIVCCPSAPAIVAGEKEGELREDARVESSRNVQISFVVVRDLKSEELPALDSYGTTSAGTVPAIRARSS